MGYISKFIYHKVLGWKTVNGFPSHIKKYVVIAAPHTSWMDFPIGVLARNSSNVPIHFLGKKSLFKPPFGFLFRWLGGIPVDRSKNTKMVDAVVSMFDQNDIFRIALSPEGTRQKVSKWKTGFYYIAKGAKVPIVMATLDFENKQIRISPPYLPTDDMEKDFEHFYAFFKNIKGKKPDLS